MAFKHQQMSQLQPAHDVKQLTGHGHHACIWNALCGFCYQALLHNLGHKAMRNKFPPSWNKLRINFTANFASALEFSQKKRGLPRCLLLSLQVSPKTHWLKTHEESCNTENGVWNLNMSTGKLESRKKHVESTHEQGKGISCSFSGCVDFKTPHVYSLLVGPTKVKTHEKIGKKKRQVLGIPGVVQLVQRQVIVSLVLVVNFQPTSSAPKKLVGEYFNIF